RNGLCRVSVFPQHLYCALHFPLDKWALHNGRFYCLAFHVLYIWTGTEERSFSFLNAFLSLTVRGIPRIDYSIHRFFTLVLVYYAISAIYYAINWHHNDQASLKNGAISYTL
ncbi:MAG: hypothetical protein IJI09_09470, partial [Clostridia bacterium]|nr:hypothetical protein [Clostridia bacterium]